MDEDLSSSTGAYTLKAGEGADTLTLNSDNIVVDDAFTSVTGVETVVFAGASNGKVLNLGAHAQAAGITTAVATGAQGDINASAYTTAVFLTASGSGAQSITGGSGSDTLVGGAGSEVITSGDGNDTMTGGAAADTFTFNNTTAGTYTITDYGVGADLVSAAGVNATINATLATVAGVTLGNTDLDADTTLNVTITDDVATTNAVSFAAGTNSGKLVVNASANNNVIVITGSGGTDTITAGAGGDSITGGIGVDSIILGAGGDDIVITSGLTADKVTGFTVGTDDIHFDESVLDDSGVVVSGSAIDFVEIHDNNSVADDGSAVIAIQTLTQAAVAADATQIFFIDTTAKYASAAAAVDELEAGGDAALTFSGNIAQHDAFLFGYERTGGGVGISIARFGAAQDASATAAAAVSGRLVAAEVAFLEDIDDITTLTAADFAII